MSAPPSGQSTLVYSLATLLRNSGDSVLDGTSTLTLQAGGLQHLTRLFEQYLLSRTHQHGFLALPSHPADTDSLLQVQFLFDMLQKTVSLKLINPAGSRLQSVVKIFPFKSLKYLELKRVPPHCLEGLRSVYSQLEVFTCSKSLSSLEELLSLCGGDLSSALPWLELHTLNFSYNSIVSLDDSLSLLNVLKSLDLSHNRIQDCAEFLLPLSELQHLNFGYNFLQRVPQLGLSGRAKLLTLILRNNELETINGVEHLSCLQHLDLAFNILMEHSQLSPLSMLHCLKTLNLEGNPLYFQKTHRTSTVRHLSPRAALLPLKLDDCTLSSSELAVLPRPGQMIIHAGQTVAGTQEVSSGGGELSDSLSMSEPGVTRLHRKKSRSKVKTRRASISEPSDTDYEPKRNSVLQDIVLPHQEDIKRMDLFRHQLGEDWLRYQHHLEGAGSGTGAQEQALAPGMPNGQCDNAGSRTPPPGTHAVPLLTSEPKEEDLDLETESTLQWPGHSPENTESTLETSMGKIHGEEEEDLEVDLCLPLLVGTITEEEEGGDVKDTRPLFLRVKPGHALEVDMQTGRVLVRLELDSLREVSTSQTTWTEKEGEKVLPVLELHFSYISRARRRRRYVILDDSPQQALQALADVLSRVAEENRHRVSEGQPECTRLQCLRCRTEFSQQVTDPNPQGKIETRGDAAAACVRGLICPECGPCDHVVLLSAQLPPLSSTPVPCPLEGDRAIQCFTFEGLDTPTHGHQEPLVDGVLSAYGSADSQGSVNEGAELSDTFHTAKNGTFYIGDENSWSDRRPSDLAGFRTPDRDNEEATPPVVGRDELAASWKYNYSAPQLLQLLPETPQGSSPGGFGAGGRLDLLSKDGEAVDHRLKLFLDVEVFQEDSEEIHGFLKMSAVKFGDPVEFPSLLVVSDQYIYILEITSEAQGQPSDWLRKRNSHRLAELRYLEVGLGSQSIHMEFVDSGAAYTLLVRDPARCKCFFELLTGLVRELAPKLDSKLESISTTRINQQHPLWPLVFESTQSDAAGDLQLQFFYLLAFVQQDDRLTPVTVLATEETLHLLDEDHQWSRSSLNAASNGDQALCGGRVTVQESQPISCVSSVHLFSSDACRVDIKLYDEMVKEERVWALQTESMALVQDLVAWVRNHWEDMFGVKLVISLQESDS